MPKVVPFSPDVFNYMELRHHEKILVEADPAFFNRFLSVAMHGLSWTLLHDGRILGCGGWYELWPGVYEIWAMPSIYAPVYATVYLKNYKRYLNVLWRENNPQRVQTTAIADELHDRWMNFLGFTDSVPLEKYTALGHDYRLWSKVRS